MLWHKTNELLFVPKLGIINLEFFDNCGRVFMTDNPVYDKLLSCLNAIREKTDFVPKVGIVLGSGLGDYAQQIDICAEIAYTEIKGFPVSTVPGQSMSRISRDILLVS